MSGKLYLLAIVSFLSVFVSCQPGSDAPAAGDDEILNVSSVDASSSDIRTRYAISASKTVELTGLEPGGIYTIYPEGAAGKAKAASAESGLIETATGTMVLIPETDTLEITGSDIGVSDGTFRIIEQIPEDGRMRIDTSSDDYLFINDQGRMVYEKYFELPVSSLSDPSAVALYASSTGSSSNSTSDYGFLINGEKVSEYGLVDLSDQESVIVFLQRHYGSLKTDSCAFELFADTPETIASSVVLSAPNIYRIGSTSDEMVLEVTMEKGALRHMSAITRFPWPRTVSEGRISGNIFPLSYSDGKLVLYIGTVPEDIIFDVFSENVHATFGNAVLRPITEEERERIITFDVSSSDTLQITIPESPEPYIQPIRFTNGGSRIAGASVSYSSDGKGSPSFFVNASNSSGFGYASVRAGRDIPSINLDSRFFLDYGYLYSFAGSEGETVTLTAK